MTIIAGRNTMAAVVRAHLACHYVPLAVTHGDEQTRWPAGQSDVTNMVEAWHPFRCEPYRGATGEVGAVLALVRFAQREAPA